MEVFLNISASAGTTTCLSRHLHGDSIAVDTGALIALCLMCAKKKRKKKRMWVHPILQRREQLGEYHRLTCEMRLERRANFLNYFRMSPELFDKLLLLISPAIEKCTTAMRKPISAAERLAVTLRFLVTGDTYRTIGYSYRIHESTVRLIVGETCTAIWCILGPKYMPIPTASHWEKISDDFSRLWQFPNCLGSIDGKHVQIQAPPRSGSMYYNYKKTYSIVLLAVADAKYRFVVVDIGAFGHQSDGSVLRHSTFGCELENGQLAIPEDAPLPGTTENLPHVFVGDEAFPLKRHLLRPYPGRGLSYEKRVFNYRLSRARRIVENTFGIMCSRFRVFRRPLCISPDAAEKVVKACTMLQNFLTYEKEDDVGNMNDGVGLDTTSANNDLPRANMLRPLARTARRGAQEALDVRMQYTHYFNSEAGAVPWQRASVLSTG